MQGDSVYVPGGAVAKLLCHASLRSTCMLGWRGANLSLESERGC